MAEKSYSREFLDKYLKLEDFIQKCYHKPVWKAEKSDLKEFEDELRMLRNLRDALSHNVTVDDAGNDLIIIKKPILDFLDETYQKITGNVMDFAVSMDNVYWVTPDIKIFEVIRKMEQAHYTHIPVLDEEGRLYGVFSENTLLKIYSAKMSHVLNEDTCISDIKAFVESPLAGYETVVVCDERTSYLKCVDIFNARMDGQERTDIILVTSDGTRNGKLRGLITTWDVSGRINRDEAYE